MVDLCADDNPSAGVSAPSSKESERVCVGEARNTAVVNAIVRICFINAADMKVEVCLLLGADVTVGQRRLIPCVDA